MVNSHVAAVSLKLNAVGFKKYRWLNLGSSTKVPLKCATEDDIATIKAGDDADVLNLISEAMSKSSLRFTDASILTTSSSF
jgi:proliferating cell nuclear antigen